MSPNLQPRLLHVDLARGFAILLVVAGHAIQYTTLSFEQNVAFRLIYAVHMPLFMFICGFVWLPFGGAPTATLEDRARSLLMPFLAWLPLSYLSIRYIQMPDGWNSSPTEFLFDVIHRPDAGGLWFLLVLFECQAVMLFAHWIGGKAVLPLAASLILALNAALLFMPDLNWFGLGLLRWHFLFFLLGHMTRRGALGVTTGSPRWNWVWIIWFSMLCAGWQRKSAVPVDWLFVGQGATLNRMALQTYQAVTAVAGIFAVMGTFAWIAERWTSSNYGIRIITWFGKNTLQIYAGHYFFLYIAVAWSVQWGLESWARQLFVATLAICGALGVAAAVKPFKRLNTMLYGR